MDEAIASYEKAISIRPGYTDAHNNLCEFFEKKNRMEELEKALGIAVQNCGENNADILFRMAQVASRHKRYSDAIGYLEKADAGRLQALKQDAYYGLLGKTFDKLGESEKAFSAFEKHNQLGLKFVDGDAISADRQISVEYRACRDHPAGIS